MNFSVLMSVYIKESPEFLKEALESILINQTLLPSEMVLVKDGPLTSELDSIINDFKGKFPTILKIVGLDNNVGLGKALNIGLQHCTNELVARMDSDDICANDRFESQIEYFKQNYNLDLVGGNIIEFYDTPSNSKLERKVPNEKTDIIKMAKRRNPINHVSVMFRKDSVIQAGGYKHLPYLEDYYLWIRMIEFGSEMANINKNLVYVRTGKAMYKRRGNKEYIKGWHKLQKEMKKMGIISNFDLMINMINIIIFIYMPAGVKEMVYKLFLRR
ncbi:MAG: glycosyltransferase [Solibacillus sp.]